MELDFPFLNECNNVVGWWRILFTLVRKLLKVWALVSLLLLYIINFFFSPTSNDDSGSVPIDSLSPFLILSLVILRAEIKLIFINTALLEGNILVVGSARAAGWDDRVWFGSWFRRGLFEGALDVVSWTFRVAKRTLDSACYSSFKK